MTQNMKIKVNPEIEFKSPENLSSFNKDNQLATLI